MHLGDEYLLPYRGMACYDDARRRADCDCGAVADDDWVDSVLDYADDEYGWEIRELISAINFRISLKHIFYIIFLP